MRKWLPPFFYLTLTLFSWPLWGAVETPPSENKKPTKEISPPKIGNFSLPTSQQPGPLVSFGENIIEKNQTQVFLAPDLFVGHKKHLFDIVPSFLYAPMDDFSIYFVAPIAASYKEGKEKSSGMEDLFLQLEYAFYSDKTSTYTDQATIVTNVTFPVGSTHKKPPIGFGSSSFFLGSTFNRAYTDWFYFTSYGVLLTTTSDKTKFGNQFLYQGGLGRNFYSIPSEFIFAWIIEINGQYSEKNKIKGKADPNSGGNTIFLTPSLWLSTKQLIVQFGFGFPIAQHLFGDQKKDKYLLIANFGWTF